jgi:hypothetical protein
MLHMKMDVEPYLKLLNKSTGGNVHVNVTHEDKSRAILETIE